ncbi:hypothetical protein P4604_08545 [Lysinibacillus capsici]|uniref:hypothetical protein n=1 Tax=Lysinibacillus capsici TaxID=2115968 RepID=UPI002E1FA87A|nr:hypothetical protein [Lysinibacillus capsici]
MAYNAGNNMPFEKASKLGHLNLVNSPWINSLISEFEAVDFENFFNGSTVWNSPLENIQPLKHIWVVDGSYATVSSTTTPPKEVAFIKTALLYISSSEVEKVDKQYPHPLDLQNIMKDSAIFHSTVLPLRNIKCSRGSNFDTVRNIIFESFKNNQDGIFFDTLKWLAYKKWKNGNENSPNFGCPYCESETYFEFDLDEKTCPSCGSELYLTDMIGFHLEMSEDKAQDSLATAYMLIMEHLMLFTVIRLTLQDHGKSLSDNTLFIKDGPLSLSSQYVKLIPNIREFIHDMKIQGIYLNIVGQEKSGKFVDHLNVILKHSPEDLMNDKMEYSVLTHKYINEKVQDLPNAAINYGKRSNWGEKVLVKIDNSTSMVINVPTGLYIDEADAPIKSDLVGLDRILATLPSILSKRYSGGLYPVELVNGITSLSSYPSSKILEKFLEGKTL